MTIFQAKIIPLVIGTFTLTGCQAIANTVDFLEFIGELYQSIRDYPRFWIAGLVIIAFYYILYWRKHNRKVERKLDGWELDRLNGGRCPYCGKRKKGMADHIAAMHPEHSERKSK
tara:strand:- start:248 stop:592 length:345 start_codon:yes stop_codon:yes gene_type:complete